MCGDDAELILLVETLPPQIAAPGVVGPPSVHCGSEQMEQMREHVSLQPGLEAGGILLGRSEVDAHSVNLVVLSSLPAEAVQSGPAHLTFTQETWRLLENRRLAQYRDALVLGWYHSHPGLGLFLSGFDRRLHQQIFGHEPWSVALVIDPIAETRAFFWCHHGKVVQCCEVGAAVHPLQRGNEGGDIWRM